MITIHVIIKHWRRDEQYGQVLEFKDKVEKENKVLNRPYNTVGEFEKFLKDDLTLYLLQEYGRKDEVLQRILRGSRTYYERLRGENGRFRMLHIEDLILSRTDTKDNWVPQPVSGEDEAYDKNETVITMLPRWWKQSRKHAVWNVVSTWQEVRGELSGADLSRLDLSRAPLNGVMCSRLYGGVGGRYLAAVFDGSRVHETNLFPRGHTSDLTSAVYSPSGDKIVTASEDGTVKEWDAATGECLRTLEGHISIVNSAVYSSSGDKIVSASWDNTVKEWDAATGECLRTLVGHTATVWSAEYSPAGDKILSTSFDGTFKEWDAATGKCLKTHRIEDNPDLSEYYSEETLNKKLHPDGNKIYLPSATRNQEYRTLINIPGLWIQGCSFKNLEKNSQWSEEALKLMKQYGASF